MRLWLHFKWVACSLVVTMGGLTILLGQVTDPVAELLSKNQRNLATDGRTFLVAEASRASFFLIGGLHGDNETPALAHDFGQRLRPAGYRYTAIEMSPWAANRMQASTATLNDATLWGSDMEEIQPHLMIRELAGANPSNAVLQSLSEMTQAGYRRSQAPALLKAMRDVDDMRDISIHGTSLRALILRTLQIEIERLEPSERLLPSQNRERFMKELFWANYQRASQEDVKPKVMLIFGRNHLHRGYDRRGVSTLGNFIAELAVAEGVQSFHVALFAAGGQVALGGLRDADQRGAEPAFHLLASLAQFPATVFDLRPIRQALRHKPAADRSATDENLIYWADSYDAIVCYRQVTPARDPHAGL